MEENLPPFELFERFVAEYSDDHLQPKIKALRSEVRQDRKARELWEAQVNARLDNLRREQEAATESLRRAHQIAIDSLTSQLVQVNVELETVRRYTAIALIRDTLSDCREAQAGNPGMWQLIVRKYEAIAIEVKHSNDPLEAATRFIGFCMDQAERGGLELIRPGIQKTV